MKKLFWKLCCFLGLHTRDEKYDYSFQETMDETADPAIFLTCKHCDWQKQIHWPY